MIADADRIQARDAGRMRLPGHEALAFNMSRSPKLGDSCGKSKLVFHYSKHLFFLLKLFTDSCISLAVLY
jgi:hypothetical protein